MKKYKLFNGFVRILQALLTGLCVYLYIFISAFVLLPVISTKYGMMLGMTSSMHWLDVLVMFIIPMAFVSLTLFVLMCLLSWKTYKLFKRMANAMCKKYAEKRTKRDKEEAEVDAKTGRKSPLLKSKRKVGKR